MNEAIKCESPVSSGGQEQVRHKGTRTTTALAITAMLLVLFGALAWPSGIMASDHGDIQSFTVDISLGLPYLQNSVDPKETKHNPDAFSPGDTFIQDGNIYPGGTILNGPTDFDPAAPGAIGKYKVRGTWTTDLAGFKNAAAHGPSPVSDLAFASELFDFQNDRSTILTDGTYPNAYFSALRAVLGGTGTFQGIVGEIQEENIGENKFGFCNFRVTFKIRKVNEGR